MTGATHPRRHIIIATRHLVRCEMCAFVLSPFLLTMQKVCAAMIAGAEAPQRRGVGNWSPPAVQCTPSPPAVLCAPEDPNVMHALQNLHISHCVVNVYGTGSPSTPGVCSPCPPPSTRGRGRDVRGREGPGWRGPGGAVARRGVGECARKTIAHMEAGAAEQDPGKFCVWFWIRI